MPIANHVIAATPVSVARIIFHIGGIGPGTPEQRADAEPTIPVNSALEAFDDLQIVFVRTPFAVGFLEDIVRDDLIRACRRPPSIVARVKSACQGRLMSLVMSPA